MTLKKGNRVFFRGEKRSYIVRACNKRYAICTKAFNLKRTVLYTIIDLKEKIRGTENLIFCMGFETDKECHSALKRLVKGESEITRRNRVQLMIDRIQ